MNDSDSNGKEPILLPSGYVAVSWKVKHRSAVRKGEAIATAYPRKQDNISRQGKTNESSVVLNDKGSGVVHLRPSSCKSKFLGSLLTANSRLHGKSNTISTAVTTEDTKSTAPSGDASRTGVGQSREATETVSSANTGIKLLAPSDGLVNICDTVLLDNPRVLGYIEPCRHPTIIDGMCAVCGMIQSEFARKRIEGLIEATFDHSYPTPTIVTSRETMSLNPSRGLKSLLSGNQTHAVSTNKPFVKVQSIPFINRNHSPDTTGNHRNGQSDLENSLSRVTVSGGITVNISQEEATNITKQNRQRLLINKRLSLVLDLDHTLVHATNDARAASEYDREDIRLILLPFVNGPGAVSHPNNNTRHYVKMRPYLKEFLLGILDKYEASIYTAGTRAYALQVVRAMCRFVVGAMDEEELIHYKKYMAQVKWKLSVFEQSEEQTEKGVDTPRSSVNIDVDAANTCESDMKEFHNSKQGNNAEETPEGHQKKRRVTFSEKTQVFVIPKDSDTELKEQIVELQKKIDDAEALELKACELQQKLFGSRVISRCDVGDLGRDVKSVRRVFPCGGMMAAIIDDREDVWANASDNITSQGIPGEPPMNLILVKPYHFDKFRGYDDVNNHAGDDPTDGKASSGSDIECDESLFWCNNILSRLHQRLYLHVAKDLNTPGKTDTDVTVPQILDQMRKEVLRGCTVALSGLIPLVDHSRSGNKPKVRSSVVRYVEDLGGSIAADVTEKSTHVIAARLGTQKVFKGSRVRGCAVVNIDWLMLCYWSISYRDVTPHLLLPIRVKDTVLEQTCSKPSIEEFSLQTERKSLTTERDTISGKQMAATCNDDDHSSDDDAYAAELESSILTTKAEQQVDQTSILLLTDDDEESDDGSPPAHSIPLRSRDEPAATQRKLGEGVTNPSTQCLGSDISQDSIETKNAAEAEIINVVAAANSETNLTNDVSLFRMKRKRKDANERREQHDS